MDAERERAELCCVTAEGSVVCSSVENNFISPVATRSATQHTLDSALRDLPASETSHSEPAGREIINFNKVTTLAGPHTHYNTDWTLRQ